MCIYDQLTVLVPSHCRHRHIQRLLCNLRDLNCRKVIIDSSPTPCDVSMYSGVDLYHKPDMSVPDKMRFGLQIVKTEFVFITPDDDLYSLVGFKKLYEYISNNHSCSTVSGHLIAFRYDSSGVNFFLKHSASYLALVNTPPEPNIKKRLMKALSPYTQTVWAIHRSDVVRNCFSEDLSWLKSLTLYERFLKMYSMIYGDVVFLDVFLGAREVENRVGLSSNLREHNLTPFVVFLESVDEKTKLELDSFVSTLAQRMSEETHEPIERSKKFIYSLFTRYEVEVSKVSTDVCSTPEMKILSQMNPDLLKQKTDDTVVISNDIFGKSYYNRKNMFPVYSKGYSSCLMGIRNLIMEFKDIYHSEDSD